MFEIFLLIYLFSGIIKAFLISAGWHLPVDLTLLAGVLVVVSAVFKFYGQQRLNSLMKLPKRDYITMLLLVLFYIWALVMSTGSHGMNYPVEKSFKFLTNILPFFSIFLVRKLNLRLFCMGFVGVTLFFAGTYFILSPNFRYYQHPALYTLDYDVLVGFGLTLSFKMAVASIFALYFIRNRVLAFSIAYFFMFMCFYVGARGSLLIVGLVLAVLLVDYIIRLKPKISLSGWKAYLKVFLGIVILQGSIYFLIQIDLQKKWTYDRAVYRTLLLFDAVGSADNTESIASYLETMSKQTATEMEISEEIDRVYTPAARNVSVFSRIWHAKFVRDKLQGNANAIFFGYGFGSYGYHCCERDARAYPHNLVLEIWFELGIVGLAIFLGFLGFVLLKLPVYPYGTMILAAIAFLLLNAMKSSSLVDMRDLFTLLAIFAFVKIPVPNSGKLFSGDEMIASKELKSEEVTS